MKYDCHDGFCAPIPLLEPADLSNTDPADIAKTNKRRMLPVKPASSSPRQAQPGTGRKRFDQFWEGTSQITIPDSTGTAQEVGKLFVSSDTTSAPGSGPATVDTWTEDWVITDWTAFAPAHAASYHTVHPEFTVTHEGTYTDAAEYITSYQIANPGASIFRMLVTFQYQSSPPTTVPLPRYAEALLFEVRNTASGAIVGYKLREFSTNRRGRDEYWLLFSSYQFPASTGELTILTPVASAKDASGGSITIGSGQDLVDNAVALTPSGQTLAYYVATFGVFMRA